MYSFLHSRLGPMLKNSILIPQRQILAVLLLIAVTIEYVLRVNLNLAITEMVPESNIKRLNFNHSLDAFQCPDDINVTFIASERNDRKQFRWSESTQGKILSSFYWGYVITHVPGGYFADKFGGKYVFGFGILLASVCTALLPIAANLGESYLLAVRFFTGFFEGVTFPAINTLLSKWVPADQRSFIGTLVFAGIPLGTVTGSLLTGSLLHAYGGDWPIVFYVCASLGVIWTIFFFTLCYSTPEKHPFITEKEKMYLREKIITPTVNKMVSEDRYTRFSEVSRLINYIMKDNKIQMKRQCAALCLTLLLSPGKLFYDDE